MPRHAGVVTDRTDGIHQLDDVRRVHDFDAAAGSLGGVLLGMEESENSYVSRMRTEIALAAVDEARLQVTTGGDQEAVTDALDLARRVLLGEEISDADLDNLHPAVAHRLRDQGHP